MIETNILSWTTQEEKNALEKLAKEVKPGGHILEIGALYGGTTVILAKSSPQSRITSIDEFSWTPEGYPTPSKEKMLADLKAEGVFNVDVIDQASEIVAPQWDKDVDLLFVDGGHSYQYIYGDLMNFAAYAQVVACHDYGNPLWESVTQAIDDFIFTHSEWYLAEVAGTVAVLRRK